MMIDVWYCSILFIFKSYSQSNDLELIINHVAHSDSGQYFCDAMNIYGSERRDVSIKVLSTPSILINSKILSLVENVTGALECIYENNDVEDQTISWLDSDGNVLQNVG